MSNNHQSRNDNLAADQAMIDGIQKNQTKLPGSFPLEGQTITPAEVVQVLQGRIDIGKAVVVADSARTAAVKADRDRRTQTRAFVLAFKRLLIAMFAQQPDLLGDFGLHPPKPATKSSADKAQAAAKAKATRTLLGTKGSRQKKAVLKAAASAHEAAAPAAPTKPAG